MIYLIRHTTPAVEKGVCYGQSDLDVTDSFLNEVTAIQPHLASFNGRIYSSPLQRCAKLAAVLFPQQAAQLHHDLKEIHCGEWEMQKWDDIPRDILDPWMNDFVNGTIPGGESYVDLFARTTRCFEAIAAMPQPAVIVTHGGVIRSLLAHITGTPLGDSFSAFSIHYGCVVKLTPAETGWQHEFLWNNPHEKEQHKPSSF
jgi:alpha-ribazole phosphatase